MTESELLEKLKTYAGNTFARVEVLLELSRLIQSALEPAKAGYTRLWRGNRSGEEYSNPSFTNSLEGIALPFWASYSGVLTYIDVPDDIAQNHLVNEGSAHDSEYILPASELGNVKLVPSLLNGISSEFILKCLQFSQNGNSINKATELEDINNYRTRNSELKRTTNVSEETVKGWERI